VQKRQCRLPRWIRNSDWEEAGILIVNAVELNAVVRPEGSQPHALPVEQILRFGKGDPWASRRKCRVSHHVVPKRFDERDTRILAATAAVGPPLVIGFRLQYDAEPLDACRIAGSIKPNSCNADARVISPRDQSREEVECTIRATNGRRIQDAFDLLGIPRFRLHQQPQALQLKSTHQIPHEVTLGDRHLNKR
jgi:hypothetical protein